MDDSRRQDKTTIADLLNNGSLNIEKMLHDDQMYKSIIASMPEDQRARIEEIIVEFVRSIQTGAVDRMAMLAQDPAFVDAWVAAMTGRK